VTRSRTAAGFVLSERTRVQITITSVAVLLVIVGWVFWVQDVKFMLPTPKPLGLVQPEVGTTLPIHAWLAPMGLSTTGRPVHLHVFNPECPCSRFNADHIRELVKTYGRHVQFVGLVQLPAGSNPEEKKDAQEQALALNLGMPLWIDEGGAIARAAGVYSTPQAVILNAKGALVFRGNYNKSRYHVNPRTEFARHALESLVGNGGTFDNPNLPAYGCELPQNTESAVAPALMVRP
jgi:hypothetical protein